MEFAEWCAYFRIEPWGGWAEDIRHTMMHFLVACANSGKDGSPKMENSMPPWMNAGKSRNQTPEEMRLAIRSWLGR